MLPVCAVLTLVVDGIYFGLTAFGTLTATVPHLVSLVALILAMVAVYGSLSPKARSDLYMAFFVMEILVLIAVVIAPLIISLEISPNILVTIASVYATIAMVAFLLMGPGLTWAFIVRGRLISGVHYEPLMQPGSYDQSYNPTGYAPTNYVQTGYDNY